MLHVAAWSFCCNCGVGEEVVGGWWSEIPLPW